MFLKFIIKFIMIKLVMDSLDLDFVKCCSSGSHKGLCFLEGDLKGVSSVCVYFSRVTYFSHANCVHFFPQFTIPDYHVQNLSSLSFHILIMRYLVCL